MVITHLLRSLDQSTAQLRIHDHLVGVIGSGPFRRSRPALRVSCNVVFCIGTPMPSSPRIGHTRRSPSPCASVTSGVATDTLPSPSLCPANDNASIVVSLACSSIELSVIVTSNPPTAAVGHLARLLGTFSLLSRHTRRRSQECRFHRRPWACLSPSRPWCPRPWSLRTQSPLHCLALKKLSPLLVPPPVAVVPHASVVPWPLSPRGLRAPPPA